MEDMLDTRVKVIGYGWKDGKGLVHPVAILDVNAGWGD